MKIALKRVLREYRNAKRRRGGFRRMRMETLLDRAWELGWVDEFRLDAIEYVARAEASMRSQEKRVHERYERYKAEQAAAEPKS